MSRFKRAQILDKQLLHFIFMCVETRGLQLQVDIVGSLSQTPEFTLPSSIVLLHLHTHTRTNVFKESLV